MGGNQRMGRNGVQCGLLNMMWLICISPATLKGRRNGLLEGRATTGKRKGVDQSGEGYEE